MEIVNLLGVGTKNCKDSEVHMLYLTALSTCVLYVQ